MRPQPEVVRLGDHAWQVRPLTLAQVQAIEPILMQGETRGTVAAALDILAIALRRDHADAADGLADIEATAPEVGAAMRSVLRLGGFIEAGDAPSGEAGAGPAPASTSA